MGYDFWLPALAISVAFGLSAPASASDVVLDPNQKWVANFGDNSCKLIRSFGDEQTPTVLVLEQYAPSESFTWTVAGPYVAQTRFSRDVTVQWGPFFDPYEQKFQDATLGTIGKAFMGRNWVSPDHLVPSTSKDALRSLDKPELASGYEPVLGQINEAEAAGVEYVSFTQKNRLHLVLRLSDLAPAIATLNKCTRDLAAEWGFDESYADRLTSTPIWSNVSDVARRIQEKYPARALSRGAQANFKVRIIVGTDGRPERCDWINETKADDFEMGRTPCDIVMEDAEFEPAIDQEDRPIRSIYQSTIRYRIP